MSAIISIFLLMFAGFIARRVGVLKASDANVVRSIVVNLTGPALIFSSIYGAKITREMVIAPAVHIAALMITLGLAYLLSRLLRLDRPTTGGVMLAAAFGNTAFLGYPVIYAAFPGSETARAAVVMVDQLGETISMYSIGIAIAVAFGTRHSEVGIKPNPLGFTKTPLFIAMMLALAFRLPFLNQIHIPDFIVIPGATTDKGVLNYLGDATIPLAMISLGLTITRVPIRSFLWPFVVACTLKFAVMPLLNYVGLVATGVGGVVGEVAMLEAAMPTAIMASVIAGRYGLNTTFVTGAVFLMTLMSAVVIPIVRAIVGPLL